MVWFSRQSISLCSPNCKSRPKQILLFIYVCGLLLVFSSSVQAGHCVCVTDLRTYVKVLKRHSTYDKNSVDTSENFMFEKDLHFIKILLLYNWASHTVSSECSVDKGSEWIALGVTIKL